ncbi:MAG: iron-sulfur cluster assembly scaffold protein [Promethearchaeota archaeon]|jgi:NifU-like protein involved in Fe-S cluster formation
MPNSLDKFVNNLQKEIIKEEIKDHSKKIVELCHNPKNWGKPPKEEITISEEKQDELKGFFLGLYLKIEDDIIIKANFITDGCGVMVATGSQLTIMISGKSVEFAEKLSPDSLISALKGIPLDEINCIRLAIKTLKNAIKKYKEIK